MAIKLFTAFMLWFLCTITADGFHHEESIFQISPKDVNIYFDTPKYFQRICAPPSDSDFVIVWWKHRKRLVDGINSRTSIVTKSDERTVQSLGLTPGSKISILSIESMIMEDEGEYSCSITNTTNHYVAKFKVRMTDNCKEGSFKCVEDKKCILTYSLCDGIGQCKNNVDESTQAGCAIPKPPGNLEVAADSPREIIIQWQPVKFAKDYQIELKYPNEHVELIKRNAALTITSIDGLQANTEYMLRIQAITLTGHSEFTNYVTVKTKSLVTPTAPLIHKSYIVTTFSDVFVSWDSVPDADTYQVILYYPNGTNLSAFKHYTVRTVRFKDLVDDTKYVVKVRARSDVGFGEFSSVAVQTKKLEPPGPPTKLSHSLHKETMGITIAWSQSKHLGNSFKPDITYSIKYCIYKLEKAHKSVEIASGVRKNSKSKLSSTAENEKKKRNPPIKNKTGDENRLGSNDKTGNNKHLGRALKKDIVPVTKLKIFDCKYVDTSQTSITLNKLQATNYWYRITTIGARNIVGKFSEGNFTIEMYISTIPPTSDFNQMASPNEEFSGIVIFAIVTASLCVILIIAFLLAWACKWQILMDAAAEYRVGVYDEKHTNISGNNHVNNHQHNNDEMYKKLQS